MDEQADLDKDDDQAAGERGEEGGDQVAKSEECEGNDRPKEKRVPPDYGDLQALLADAITFKSPLQDIALIVKCGGEINKPVRKGLKALHYAVYVNYLKCIELLIKLGADVNAPDDLGYTPLHLSSGRGYLEAMKMLVENGANINYCDADESQPESQKAMGYLTLDPLNIAIENNHVECVRYLLDNGSRPDHKYFLGYEINLVPLEHIECLELLLKSGADPNVFNRCGTSPLIKACKNHGIETVRLLIKYGADVDLVCPPLFEQKSPLHFAVKSSNILITHILLQHGAKTRRPENYKYSALHTAVMRDRADLCDILLKWKADVNEPTDEGSTPLQIACATPSLKCRTEIIEILFKYGADPNSHASFPNYTDPYLSPMVEYFKNNGSDVYSDIVEILIRHGAIVMLRDEPSTFRCKNPFSVLDYIREMGDNEKILNLLIEGASCINAASVRKCHRLTSFQRQRLLAAANAPAGLKHICRIAIRDRLLPFKLADKIEKLYLPNLLKKYLAFC